MVKGKIKIRCGNSDWILDEVVEHRATLHFFGHKGHPHDGLAVTHRPSGSTLGVYPDEQAEILMRKLEESGADWDFEDVLDGKCKLAKEIAVAIIREFEPYLVTDFHEASSDLE